MLTHTKKCIHIPRYNYIHTHRHTNIYTDILLHICISPTKYSYENSHTQTSVNRRMHEYVCLHTTTIIYTFIFSNTYAYELKHLIVHALMGTQRPLYLYKYVQEHAENFCLVFLLPKNQELIWIAA